MHLEAWKGDEFCLSCPKQLGICLTYSLAAPCGLWGAKEWPKGHQAICVWQILQPDHLSGHRCIFFSCFGTAIPQELWAEPFPQGKPFHHQGSGNCSQTEPTSSLLLFLSEGNDLHWTPWGHRPQQTLINCVIYCLTRLCVDPSHVPV